MNLPTEILTVLSQNIYRSFLEVFSMFSFKFSLNICVLPNDLPFRRKETVGQYTDRHHHSLFIILPVNLLKGM